MNAEYAPVSGIPSEEGGIDALQARLSGPESEPEYDMLLQVVCQERGFSKQELREILETSDLVTQAMKGHLRKDKITSTSVHYKRVAIIVASVGGDAFNIKHALCHDLIEDSKEFKAIGIRRKPITVNTLRLLFGDELAEAVGSVTKVKTRALKKLAGKKPENQFVDRNLLLRTHYKLFESLKDPRVIITKLADRLDYFLTLIPDIPKANVRRKALETLELYVPLADALRMRELREKLTYHSLLALVPKGVSYLEQMNETVYSPGARRLMEAEIYSALASENASITPLIVAASPSWWRAYNDYGSFLDGVTRVTENPPVIYVAIPLEPTGTRLEDKRHWLAQIRLFFDRLDQAYGFSRESWDEFSSAYMEGELVDLPAQIGNRSVVFRIASSDYFRSDLAPIVDQKNANSAARRDFRKLRENFDQLIALWPPNKFGQNKHLGMIVGEIIDHLHRPLVRIYGNDGNAFVFPKGATLFDAACLFGKRIVRKAGRIEVKYGSATFHNVSLSERLRDGQHIFIHIDEGKNNFTPDALPLAHTRLARNMLKKELLKQVRVEKDLVGKKPITEQLVLRGAQIFRGLYEEQTFRVDAARRNLNDRDIASLFTHPAINPIVRDTTFPTYESFMIALSLDQMATKKRQNLLNKLMRRLVKI